MKLISILAIVLMISISNSINCPSDILSENEKWESKRLVIHKKLSPLYTEKQIDSMWFYINRGDIILSMKEADESLIRKVCDSILGLSERGMKFIEYVEIETTRVDARKCMTLGDLKQIFLIK